MIVKASTLCLAGTCRCPEGDVGYRQYLCSHRGARRYDSPAKGRSQQHSKQASRSAGRQAGRRASTPVNKSNTDGKTAYMYVRTQPSHLQASQSTSQLAASQQHNKPASLHTTHTNTPANHPMGSHTNTQPMQQSIKPTSQPHAIQETTNTTKLDNIISKQTKYAHDPVSKQATP